MGEAFRTHYRRHALSESPISFRVSRTVWHLIASLSGETVEVPSTAAKDRAFPGRTVR
jgi:hypothetical protein